MVGAQVVVVESGTESCNRPHRDLRGIISSVSDNCFYIAYEKMVVSAAVLGTVPAGVCKLDHTTRLATINSTDSATPSTTFIVERENQHVTAETLNATDDQSITMLDEWSSTVCVESAGLDTEPPVASVSAAVKGKILTWVKRVVVRRVLKATCILVVLLPRPHSQSDAGKDIGAAAGDEDRICLLYGSRHMPFATRTLT
jgi:hypothetical protein